MARIGAAGAAESGLGAPGSTGFAELVEAGHVARGEGDLTRALELFRRAAAKAPEHVGVRLETAAVLQALGRLAEAEAIYRRILEQAPGDFGAHVGLGHAARKRGDRTESVGHFEAAVRAQPDHAGALAELAEDYRELGRQAEAESVYRAILDREPASLPALMGLGHLARQANDRAAAREIFRRAARLHPSHREALVELAVEERVLGDLPASGRALRAVLDADPDHLGALLQSIENALLADDGEGARSLAAQAMSAHPAELAPSLLASRVLARQGSPTDALGLLDRAQRRHGPRGEILAGRLEILRSLGAWREARSLAARGAALARGHFWLWLQIVLLHLDLGDAGGAAELLEHPPAATPVESALVRTARGRLAEEAGRLEDAAAHYEAALRANPHDGWRHVDSARVALLDLRLDAAAAQLRAHAASSFAAARRHGRPAAPSQSQLGQILDEYRLDAVVVERLRALRALPEADRIEPLTALIRDNPNSTAAAVELVLVLRKLERIAEDASPAPASGPAASAPKAILQYWDEPIPPADVQAVMQSWRTLNPGFRYTFFDDRSAQDYLRSSHSGEVLRAYRRTHHAAQRADLLRLAVLQAEGGIYADADDRCVAPLDRLLRRGPAFLAYREEYGTLANDVLCAAPRHPVITRALELCVEALNRGDHDMPWLATGPALLTRAFAQTVAEARSSWRSLLKRSAILERSQLHRWVVPHQMLGYKGTPKHWVRSSFREGMAKAATARGATGIPTYATLLNTKVILPSGDGRYVDVERGFLRDSLERLILRTHVDAGWYLRQYPDVEAAIARGLVSGAAEHYARFGFYEHRRPYPIRVDERWYLQAYADVREAVAEGRFASAQAHFDAVGYEEGRLPCEGFTLRPSSPIAEARR